MIDPSPRPAITARFCFADEAILVEFLPDRVIQISTLTKLPPHHFTADIPAVFASTTNTGQCSDQGY